MSNSNSRYAMRRAGGSKVFSQEPDYTRILRLLHKVGDVGCRAGLESRILKFLEVLQKPPSLAKTYGLSEIEVAKLVATWGHDPQAWGQSMTESGRKKLEDALNNFIG